jgi:hypothetical protein
MASTERSILERIKANCKTIDGSGSYNYDFNTNPDAVILGMEPPGVAPRAPGIYIFTAGGNSNRDKGRTPLNSFSREMRFQINVWVPRTTESAENGMLAALDATSDVRRVIELDPTCGGLVHDVEIDYLNFDGDVLELPGYGVASLMVTCNYHAVRGAQ